MNKTEEKIGELQTLVEAGRDRPGPESLDRIRSEFQTEALHLTKADIEKEGKINGTGKCLG